MLDLSFRKACELYDTGDYRGAMRKFTEILKDANNPLKPGETGKIYHHIGNCLMKLKNPEEAIKAYKQAATDASYVQKGALFNNIAMAYASCKNYDSAVAYFEKAVEDKNYLYTYKAYNGMGSAELKLGNTAEAGKCFREAALDEKNPDPAKSLLNLGVCFMSLNRPEDAIVTYKSALDFDMSKSTKNKLLSSLGQALTATGKYQEAVDNFSLATKDGSYKLSDSASVDLQKSISELNKLAKAKDKSGDLSGLDVEGEAATPSDDPFYYDEGAEVVEDVKGYVDAYDDDEKFFTATEDELKELSRGLAKKDRKRRNVGLKIAVAVVVLVAVCLAGGAFGYIKGYGFPTSESVAKELFVDPENPNADIFSPNLTSSNIKSMMNVVQKDGDAEVLAVERNMQDNTVYLQTSTDEGGTVRYKVVLERGNLIGWKVANVDFYFASNN